MRKNTDAILVSRTDSIGDVVLTLPLCSWLKAHFPNRKIIFLCRNYTAAVVSSYRAVDKVLTLEELTNKNEIERAEFFNSISTVIHVFPNKQIAKWAKIYRVPERIGTSHRIFHWWTCNQKVNFTRKNSSLHEAQLNFFLLQPLGCTTIPLLETIGDYFADFQPQSCPVPEEWQFLAATTFYILHPKSQGSALEWPIEKYIEVAKKLAGQHIHVIFSGTKNEGEEFRAAIPQHPFIHDASGAFSLDQFIQVISWSKGLLACSTGPYHLAGMLGKRAVGIFSSRRPIHPGRWQSPGKNATALVFDPNCARCSKGESCLCLLSIDATTALQALLNV